MNKYLDESGLEHVIEKIFDEFDKKPLVIEVNKGDLTCPSACTLITNAINEGRDVFVKVINVDTISIYRFYYDGQTIAGLKKSGFTFVSFYEGEEEFLHIDNLNRLTFTNKIISYSTHSHGNITSEGKISGNTNSIANGDRLVITKSSLSGKMTHTTLQFDGSTTTQALARSGTWQEFYQKPSSGTSSQFLKGDGSLDSNSYALSSHTHNYASLTSPALSGTPTTPTPAAGTNNTQIANTSFVQTIISGKADKVTSPTSGHFAGLDSNGNLTDSGSKASDFASASQGLLANTALQPEDLNEYHPELNAGNLLSYEPATTEEFMYRKTNPYNSNVVQIENIKGRSVVWNQHIKGVVATTTDGITKTMDSSGIITFSGTTNSTYFNPFITTWGDTSSALNGAQPGEYYLKVDVINNPDNLNLKIFALNGKIIFTYSSDDFTKSYTAIGTLSDTTAGNGFGLASYGEAGTVFNNVKIRVQLIYLTHIYGSGNEPSTVEDFKADYLQWFGKNLNYEPYDIGSLKSVKMSGIKTTGFNQWDEEWEQGAISVVSGGYITDQTRIRPRNYIKVLPNTDYYFYVISKPTEQVYVLYYENSGNDNKIAYDSLSNSRIFTTPENCNYIKFSFETTANYGGSYLNDICINISDPDRNGTYEPYEEYNTTIPITSAKDKFNFIFPDGLKSIGDLRDEIYVQGSKTYATKRIGSVDLGGLTWSYNSTYKFFACSTSYTPNDMKRTSGIAAVCSKYVRSIYENGSDIYSNTVDKQYQVNGGYVGGEHTIAVRDTAYGTNANNFKAGMNGVYLYYELAEPVTYELDNFSLPKSYRVNAGGTEELILDNGCVPTLSIKEGVDAVGIINKLENNTTVYRVLMEKTFEPFKMSASTTEDGWVFFMNVTPTNDNYYAPWTIKYKLWVDTSDPSRKGIYDCEIGTSGTNLIYKYYNNSTYYPVYSHLIAYYNSAAKYANRTINPIKIGERIQSSYDATLARTFKIQVIEINGCTVSFTDKVEIYRDVYTDDKYGYCTAINATSNGLQETGDASYPNYYNYEYYTSYKIHSASTPLYRYKFCGLDSMGRVVPINSTNQTNAAIIQKTPNTVPMDISKGILLYYTTGVITATTQSIGSATMYRSASIYEPCTYNFNTLPDANDSIYLVGDCVNGYFTLDTTSANSYYLFANNGDTEEQFLSGFTAGKYYWYLGDKSNAANAINFFIDNPVYYFDGTSLIPYDSVDNKTQLKSASTGATVTLEPYKTYDFGTLSSSMAISLDTSKEISGFCAEYCFRFTAGSGCSITLPSGVKMSGGAMPVYATGRVYEFSISDNLCAVGEFY